MSKKISKKKEIPSNLRRLLEMKQETFEKFVADFHEFYKQGRINFRVIGASGNVDSQLETMKLLAEKYKLSESRVHRIEVAILACIHFLLYDEVDRISKLLPDDVVKNFTDKIECVAQMMQKDDTIRNSFLMRCMSKMSFYGEVEWEAEMKIFSSPNQFLPKVPIVPVGRVRLITLDPTTYPPRRRANQFEMSLKDVENMIRDLGDLQRALKNLETVEVVPKKAK
jgi:hypothetical protein